MKWVTIYLVGYILFMAGVFLALWNWGVLDDLGSMWTSIIGLLALGLGVMIAVSASGRKETLEIDSK
jgi:hypothetical protein